MPSCAGVSHVAGNCKTSHQVVYCASGRRMCRLFSWPTQRAAGMPAQHTLPPTSAPGVAPRAAGARWAPRLHQRADLHELVLAEGPRREHAPVPLPRLLRGLLPAGPHVGLWQCQAPLRPILLGWWGSLTFPGPAGKHTEEKSSPRSIFPRRRGGERNRRESSGSQHADDELMLTSWTHQEAPPRKQVGGGRQLLCNFPRRPMRNNAGSAMPRTRTYSSMCASEKQQLMVSCRAMAGQFVCHAMG